jgi:hypothetical protein
VDVFARIQYDGARLSITGVEGPRRNGDAWGSTGQIAMGYAHRDESDNDQRYDEPSRIEEWAEGWNEDLWFDFLDAWKVWHLNDMQAGCEHQRALGWTSYDAHPSEPCPVCGYKYGSAWRTTEVPSAVLDFLDSLPESAKTPAWV